MNVPNELNDLNDLNLPHAPCSERVQGEMHPLFHRGDPNLSREMSLGLLSHRDDLNGINVRQWFVIQTKPGNEHRVETNLSNQEIEVFLPLLETFQYSHEKMIPKIKPLFPNYLFAKLNIDVHYYKVKWTRGVSKILGIGNEPISISEKVIQTIKERMGENNLVKLDEGLEEGNLVQFTSGPFKDLMGVFDKRISDGKRVRVLLSLIGVDVPVQVSRWQIKKVA